MSCLFMAMLSHEKNYIMKSYQIPQLSNEPQPQLSTERLIFNYQHRHVRYISERLIFNYQHRHVRYISGNMLAFLQVNREYFTQRCIWVQIEHHVAHHVAHHVGVVCFTNIFIIMGSNGKFQFLIFRYL